MSTVLHILTKPEDTLAQAVLARQQPQAELRVEVVDLTCRVPDYAELLRQIFAADSVQVW
jgi:hypothetical protein